MKDIDTSPVFVLTNPWLQKLKVARTDTSGAGSVGFVGATSKKSRIIHPVADCPQSLEQILMKGHAVALYCDLVRETLWLVADEEDAQRLIEQGERRGAIYTQAESQLVTRIKDSEIVKQVHAFKREFNTRMLPPDHCE